jgi:hypothetical protein
VFDLDAVALGGAGDDAFAEREAECEVLQVGGRGHHHRMRDAVVDQRDRRLVDDHVLELGQNASPHARNPARTRRRRQRSFLKRIRIVAWKHRRVHHFPELRRGNML